MGGITIGYEVARALGVRSLWVERDRSGQMALRRGWEINPAERVLVIEDVWTTGGSTRETIGVVEQEEGLAVAAGALIDRSGGRLELNVPSRALLEMDVPSYEPDDCPLCRAGGVIARPGSRHIPRGRQIANRANPFRSICGPSFSSAANRPSTHPALGSNARLAGHQRPPRFRCLVR